MADARAQSLTIINESGLYSLALTSRKPAARCFMMWIITEVYPSVFMPRAATRPRAL
jgi:prophage antirepressor-like protein